MNHGLFLDANESFRAFMSQLYQTKIWQVTLSSGWQARSLLFDCATFYKPDGVGQISVMLCPEDFKQQEALDKASNEAIGKLRGSSRTNKSSRTFSRTWWLFCKGRWLIVEYNCAPSNAEIERSEVDEILQSFAESEESTE
jgi:hypothetical protein